MDLELPFSFFSTLKRVYKLSHNTITSTTTMIIIIITYGLATRIKNDCEVLIKLFKFFHKKLLASQFGVMHSGRFFCFSQPFMSHCDMKNPL